MTATWMKRGLEAQQELAREEAAREARRNSGLWRFYLKPGEEAPVTFIDGKLDANGVLDVPTYYQHTLFMNGNWNNHFVCTRYVEPCPICASGDTASIVSVFTVIDHRETKGTKDPSKTYTNQRKLFVAKAETTKALQNIAHKRGGLAGLRIDIFRTSDRSPGVGNQFDVIEKLDVAELRKKYTVKDENGKVETYFLPADYEKEIIFRTAEELRTLGFGPKTKIKADTADTEDDLTDEDIPF